MREQQLLRLEHVVAQQLLGVLREVTERLERRQDLGRVGLGGRLALLALDQRGDLLGVVDDRLAQLVEQARPLTEEVRAQAGKAALAAAIASPACVASSSVVSAKAAPVAGLTTCLVPARPAVSRPATHEWNVSGAAALAVAIRRF